MTQQQELSKLRLKNPAMSFYIHKGEILGCSIPMSEEDFLKQMKESGPSKQLSFKNTGGELSYYVNNKPLLVYG